MSAERPSLPEFERLVARREHEHAYVMALAILRAMDGRYGKLDGVDAGDMVPNASPEEIAREFCTRFAAAFGQMISDPDFQFTPQGFEALMSLNRWVDMIFAVSGFRASDHLLPLLAAANAGEGWSFTAENALRLFAVLSPNSRFEIAFDQCWRARPGAAATAFLQYISSRYVFRPRAFDFRERLLEWLPDRLDDVKLGATTLSGVAEIYMHCSYAMTPRKHDIKGALIRQMRRMCLDAGFPEMTSAPPVPPGGRPTIVVTAEHFNAGHAVYRTHSEAVRSLRAKFHVVGVVHPKPPGPPVDDLFDEIIAFPPGGFVASARALAEEILARKPQVVFHLGVGMVSKIIALASLRLAPVQCASFGHTATTMSPAIDYMVLPEDFVGSPECFSEKILAVPKAAFPFLPPGIDPQLRREPASTGDGTIRIAVPASTMKLNPRLLRALAAIQQQAKSRVEYQFYPLAARGITHLHLGAVVAKVVRNSMVFPELPYEAYLTRLAACDFFVSPFPYGNMNSIIDAVSLGLPGICLDGPEAHAHADAAMFARMGFPPELSAQNLDDYIAGAVSLVDDAAWRMKCRRIAADCDLHAAFFNGQPSLFCDAIAALIEPASRAGGARPQVARAL